MDSLKARAATVGTEHEITGVRIVSDVEANRIRIFFPGKPSRYIRAELKSRAFRWAPRVGAWQHMISKNAEHAALEIVTKFRSEAGV